MESSNEVVNVAVGYGFDFDPCAQEDAQFTKTGHILIIFIHFLRSDGVPVDNAMSLVRDSFHFPSITHVLTSSRYVAIDFAAFQYSITEDLSSYAVLVRVILTFS
ncbi:hypothetical protein Y032_0110g160 [Ancylostoma ceylanicum]|uniref:Uncharacterized protein n=1 Tax=Ancylostoma ceylanicum TaxID=53326 RepID=A0A016TEJ7_9BILA|nr:hypothetical protein Y032_0110g160 [Ancylostoma ceylanicum]